MAKTVIGLFDSFDEAQSVVQELIDGGFRRDDISVVANNAARGNTDRAVGEDTNAPEGAGTGAVGGSVVGGALGLLIGAGLLAIPGIGPVLAAGPLAAAIGTTAATVGAGALGAGIGAATGGLLGGLVGAGVPEDEANYYTEGVRRGGTLITVNADDARANAAYAIMQRHNVIDIKQRGTEWRESGWERFDDTAQPMDRSQFATTNSSSTMGSGTMGTSTRGTSTTRSGANGDMVLPVVEEELDVSKRRVERGGVRVETRVEERPVEENVSLREERVNVERRPVDRPVTDADATAFREEHFELTESVEEPVVSKRARVVEEVVIDRDVTERTETVRDTVRRTDVSVNDMRDQEVRTTDTNTMGAATGYDAFDSDYRSHYQSTYSSGGYSYDDYQPVYRYGHALATDQRYNGREWNDIETDARTHWERHNPGTWEQFKDTVRYSWDKVRGKR